MIIFILTLYNHTVFLSIICIVTGLTLVPSLLPPSEVLSANPVIATYPTLFNLNTGAVFNISCTITHSSNLFSLYFDKDGVVISDGDLVNTRLTETVHASTERILQLNFLNFQPVHDGAYHCFANTSDTNENATSDLYLYGSGEHCLLHV